MLFTLKKKKKEKKDTLLKNPGDVLIASPLLHHGWKIRGCEMWIPEPVAAGSCGDREQKAHAWLPSLGRPGNCPGLTRFGDGAQLHLSFYARTSTTEKRVWRFDKSGKYLIEIQKKVNLQKKSALQRWIKKKSSLISPLVLYLIWKLDFSLNKFREKNGPVRWNNYCFQYIFLLI